MKRRVLLLMSDTGGGHRASAEAIQTALYSRYGHDQVDVTLVDVFRTSGFPMNIAPAFYPWLINHSQAVWGWLYHLVNSKRRAWLLSRLIYRVKRKQLARLVRENQADVVVSCHSVITNAAFWAWGTLDQRPPFLAVITNLISTHPIGYNPSLELTMIPNEIALQQALACDMPPDRLEITGLPVNPAFAGQETDKATVRERLGWLPDKFTVLMVAGGDGMGKLDEAARAVNDLRLDIQLAIVTGRNTALKTRLENMGWNQPTYVYPFVTNIPELMRAADVLVTKAGPSTISEAAILGLPLLLTSAIPGQETANVGYVVEHGAGAWSPTAAQVAATLQAWVNDPSRLQAMSANARKLAHPDAVWKISDRIMEWAQHPPIPNR